ncbi:MAG: 50S ribosomal protein L9 [Chlamydiia bacterium]|nr:50S ribosomal protein L9 [Chlamydiia bacterium]
MATKLLLLKDVDDLGRSGDIVTVKPGYARNFLLPQKCALVADQRSIRLQAKLQEERQMQAAQDKKEAEELAARLAELTLTQSVKIDPEGHMYGSVSGTDIVTLLAENHGITLSKKAPQMKHPVKEIGVHTINLKLNEGVMGSLKLKVVAEEEHHAPEAESTGKG